MLDDCYQQLTNFDINSTPYVLWHSNDNNESSQRPFVTKKRQHNLSDLKNPFVWSIPQHVSWYQTNVVVRADGSRSKEDLRFVYGVRTGELIPFRFSLFCTSIHVYRLIMIIMLYVPMKRALMGHEYG